MNNPIHHVQGDLRSAGTEVGPPRDDGRHRQHDRRVLIRADSFHQAEPGYNHCFVSKLYVCFHGMTNAMQCSDHRSINPDKQCFFNMQ